MRFRSERDAKREKWRRPAAVLVGLAAAAAIVGCATPPTEPARAQDAAAGGATAAAPAPAASAGSETSADPIPEINVTGAMLYQIMAAEIAVQRGEIGSAYATYLALARQTRDPRLARRATEIALGGRAVAQALEAARLWREIAPASAEAKQTLAALLVANDRLDEAETLFAEQLRAAAQPHEELARIQRALARAPDRGKAFTLLERLARPYRNDAKIGADVRLVLASGAHAAGDAARAIEEARAALLQRPDFERAAIIAAQLLTREDAPGTEGTDKRDPRLAKAQRAQALALLESFLVRQPNAAQARTAYARMLVADQQYRAASAQFELLLKHNARDLDTLYALGLLALQDDRRADAKRYFERFVHAYEEAPQSDRDPDPVYLNLAQIAEDDKQYDEAMRWLQRVDGGSDRVTARVRQALLLGKMQRVDDGRRLLADTSTDNDQQRLQLTLGEAQLLRTSKRYNEAFDFLAGSLAKAPDDPTLLYETAMAAEKLDRIDVMERHLRRLMELKPDDANAYNALGYSLADRNQRLPEALELIERALKLAPQDAFILDSMGWVYFRMGNVAQARTYLERAYKIRADPEVATHLGEVLWVLGEQDAARALWREAQRKEPDNETLRATLARFKVRL
jgi:Flp pilus assembly protein TadD